MPNVRKEWVRYFFAYLLAVLFAFPVNTFAETAHVVSPADLRKQMVKATQVKAQNAEKVRSFLSTPLAEQTMRRSHMDPVRIKNGIAGLSDQELAQLAARADKAQRDFAAGYLTTRDIALIILGVAVIILIIVVAH